MSFECLLCGHGAADAAAYAEHLERVHGLVDDEGTSTIESLPEPFSPIEPVATRPVLPDPPVLLPPPDPVAPVAPVERVVPKAVVATIAGVIVVIALAAMMLVGRSSSPRTQTATRGADSSSTAASNPSTSTSTTPTSAPPTGVVASSTSTTDSVDPLEANSVARQLWQGITTALSARDVTALADYEDGPLLEADIGRLCQVGCPPPVFAPALSVTVNVPHQTGWPAVFFATVRYPSECHSGSSPCVNEFVAAQPAAGAPWRATLLIQYGGTTLSETPTLIADGYASPGPDTGIVPGLLDDYANYYQAIKHTGAKPESTVLDDGPFTSDLQIYDPPQAQAERGITLTGSYFVDPKDPIYTFAAGGGTTACGAIRYTSTMTSLDGTPLPASRSLDEWAMRIAQGSYSSMTLTGLHMACFYRRDGSATWTVIANWGGNASVSGR